MNCGSMTRIHRAALESTRWAQMDMCPRAVSLPPRLWSRPIAHRRVQALGLSAGRSRLPGLAPGRTFVAGAVSQGRGTLRSALPGDVLVRHAHCIPSLRVRPLPAPGLVMTALLLSEHRTDGRTSSSSGPTVRSRLAGQEAGQSMRRGVLELGRSPGSAESWPAKAGGSCSPERQACGARDDARRTRRLASRPKRRTRWKPDSGLALCARLTLGDVEPPLSPWSTPPGFHMTRE